MALLFLFTQEYSFSQIMSKCSCNIKKNVVKLRVEKSFIHKLLVTHKIYWNGKLCTHIRLFHMYVF